MRIILGSSSPRRKELIEILLNTYNLPFEIKPSDASEDELKEKIKKPDILVEELSYLKATDVYKKYEEEKEIVVIGADTVVYFENQILGKPEDECDAKRMLNEIQGKSNDVYTGMTVLIKLENELKEYKTHTVSRVYMKKMSKEDILEYIETEDPLDKAGSYAIQGYGSKYIYKYEGDYNTIVGLDTGKLEKILKENNIIGDKTW